MPVQIGTFGKFKHAAQCLKKIEKTTRIHKLVNSSVIYEERDPVITTKTVMSRRTRKLVQRITIEENHYIRWEYEVNPDFVPSKRTLRGIKVK